MPKLHHASPVKPQRVVILGAAGFVARDLARQLNLEGIPNVAISSRDVDLCRPESVQQLEGLVRSEDSLVVTSALTPEKGKDVKTFMRNIAMVNHVCAFFETHSCRHLVYLSSDAVYSDQSSLVSEETPLCPKGLYALMHCAREQMLESAVAKPRIPLCLVRPCAIYGSGDTHNSYGPNRFIRTAVQDKKIVLFGNGEEERDHVYIQDVSRFLVLCLTHQMEGAMNIVSGKAVSFHDLAQSIVALMPHSSQVECLPRATPITHRHFDVSLRLKTFPGFHTTPLETGLAQTVKENFDKSRA
jgi:UDP-glucose 4-epimerase